MDKTETPVASQPGMCTLQTSPMESSQFISAQNLEMPTWKQTTMTSVYSSTPKTTSTQNSTVLPEHIDFHFGEPSETDSLHQQVVSTDQTQCPTFFHEMELNSTSNSCLAHPQMIAVSDNREIAYNENYWMKTLRGNWTPMIYNTATCESQKVNLGNNLAALCGSQADQDPNEDYLIASVCDQTFRGNLEMPSSGEQTYYTQMKSWNGGHLTLYENQMIAPNCSQNFLPNQIINSFSDQTPFGDQQRKAVADEMLSGDQMIASHGDQAFYEHQMTDAGDYINRYGQMTSWRSQNVNRDPVKLLSGDNSLYEHQTSVYAADQDLCVDHQRSSPVGDQPLYDSQMSTLGFDTTHPVTNREKSNKENLSFHLMTSSSCEKTFNWGQMETSFAQNVYPDQKGPLNVEKSLDPQVISIGNQTPYVGISPCPSTSFLAQRQPLENSSASSLIQGQHPKMTSSLKTQKTHHLKPYLCSYQDCGKSYTKSHHLKDHMRKHTGEKPFVCNAPGCEWKFTRSVDLIRHQNKHDRKRSYPCSMCNKTFSRLCYRRQHENKKHNQSSPTNGT